MLNLRLEEYVQELKKIEIRKPKDKINRNVRNDSDIIHLGEDRPEKGGKEGKLIKMKKDKSMDKLQNQINITNLKKNLRIISIPVIIFLIPIC